MRLPGLWWLPFGGVPEVSPHEFRNWLERDRPLQVIDARTSGEFWRGTIGAARHAPLGEMPSSIARLDLDPSLPVVVLCLSGHRSQPGVRWLRARGYEAYSLRGGVLAWKRAGFSVNQPSS